MADVYLEQQDRNIVACHCCDESISENDKGSVDAKDADDHQQECYFDEPSVRSVHKCVCVEGLEIVCEYKLASIYTSFQWTSSPSGNSRNRPRRLPKNETLRQICSLGLVSLTSTMRKSAGDTHSRTQYSHT